MKADMKKALFVDDCDVSFTKGLGRVIHPGEKYPGNPVVSPDKPWENNLIMGGTVRKEGAKYRMWYQDQARAYLNLYAESSDGIHWTKPVIGKFMDFDGNLENNIFLNRISLRPHRRRDYYSKDKPIDPKLSPMPVNQDVNPNILFTPHMGEDRRYTLISFDYGRSGYTDYNGYCLAFSRDGVHWTDGLEEPVIPCHADVGWFMYDEMDKIFRGMVKTIFDNGCRGYTRRCIMYTESHDAFNWTLPKPPFVPDEEDDAWGKGREGYHTQFYGMPIFRYGSILLGFLQVFRVTGRGSSDGEIDLQLVSSRDGHVWKRVGDRKPILELGKKGEWDCGMVLSGNSLVVDGDEVRLYYFGSNRTHGQTREHTAIGLATWPRDRFVGLKTTEEEDVLQTVPKEAGKKLHINVDASKGRVSAELFDETGRQLEGFAASNCELCSEDTLNHVFRWDGKSDCSELLGRHVAVHLRLSNAEVFSLWWE